MDETSTRLYDPVLLDQLRRGQADAFESLYRQYYRMIGKLVADFQAPQVDAQDVFQDVLFVLVKKIREPRFELHAKLSTLMYAIGKNIMLKKTGKKVEFTADETALLKHGGGLPDPGPADTDTLEARTAALREKLQALEPDCRQLIWLSFYEKLPQAQIAGIMSYSEAFIRVKKFRCLEYLRRLVKNDAAFQNL